MHILEKGAPPRVCFAPSPSLALLALLPDINPLLWVYRARDKEREKLIEPPFFIPDREVTREVVSLSPIGVDLVQEIFARDKEDLLYQITKIDNFPLRRLKELIRQQELSISWGIEWV
jgi:hypothetical protein